ncbi:MAG: phosphoadenylyl-sulfate reductase [Pseudomonadota bacterium]|jgi:phosphoadenosine phosphosulfate reductase
MSLELKIETAKTLLRRIEAEHAPAVLANSFGAEDMVLTDLIVKHAPRIGIFSLDTGRLPQETYDLMKEVADRYGVRLQVYFPDNRAVEEFVSEHGVNAFYDSVELRKACCRIRKVEPLRRALAGKQAWVTGLRREQAPTRQNLGVSEWDADNGLQKFSPLIEWTQIDVWSYIREFGVPYNKLHDRHYPSIGCAPCTRAITAGEDIRAGRWWWEDPESKECGLHKRKEVA